MHSAEKRNCKICICVFVRIAISAFGKIFALQICAFCAQTVFAHLHICQICTRQVFTHLQNCRKVFVNMREHEIVFVNMREHANYVFSYFVQKSHFLSKFVKMSKKSKFPKMSRKCPKKAHVFLSGTRVVPGPTRLTTQGGKSRQNMH